jgi:ABC-2 type transport system ATP-binding protein
MIDTAVQATNLGKSFGAKQVIRDLSFEVAPGDVIGVLGKNGAVKVRVGFVPQQDELLEQLNVAEQLRVIASFYPHWDAGLITRLCGEWGLDPKARIKKMSVGERQKLSILLAFGHTPDLLVLDEPVASLDPVARRQFLEQLVEASAGGDRAIIFSSHIVSDIERLANRIWILKEGRLDWQGDLDSLKESIVRLHVRGDSAAITSLAVPGALSLRREVSSATAVVRDWTPERQRALEEQAAVSVEIEALGLEEIFLELHR